MIDVSCEGRVVAPNFFYFLGGECYLGLFGGSFSCFAGFSGFFCVAFATE